MTSFLRAGCGVAALVAATPALAQPPSAAELGDLVRAQAAEIAELRKRLDRLEQAQGTAVAAATPAVAVPPAAAPAPAAGAPTQVATASTSRRPITSPYAPQLVPPGPADRDVERVRAAKANLAGVTTEWGAGFPVFHSADGVFTFKPRGRILTDVSTTTGSRFDGRNITTTGMRALRLGIEGGVGTHFFWQFETDFSENQVDIVTAFLGARGKLGRNDFDVRVGHLFNDRGFEGGTGSDSTPFLERTVVATAIIPQVGFYGLGAMGRYFWKTGHASIEVTGDRIDGVQATSDSRIVTARAHWNPIKSERRMLHVGLWGFDENLSDAARTITRNTVIGGRFNGALRVSTGPITGATGTTGYGAELGGYSGPLWVMGEVGRRRARLDGGRRDLETTAWSLSSGFFVTGDLPPYNPRTGNFTQPRVLRPVFDGGPGAIELTARYENLDFDNLLTTGDGWAATVGVNWYVNSFARIMLNGIHWNTRNRSGAYQGRDDGETFSARFAVTF